MRLRNIIGSGAAILILASLAWGCASSQVERKVSLFYQGPNPTTVIRSSAVSKILVSPFVDLRKGKSTFGTYGWGNANVTYSSTPGTVSEAVTNLTIRFLQDAGVKTVTGKWDGSLDSLPSISADHAIYGEIERLDFSGRGRFYKADKKGIVRLKIKWGDKRSRKIVTRSVEVTPDLQQFHLLDSSYDHVARMEGTIRKAVNRAIREGMSSLFNNSRRASR